MNKQSYLMAKLDLTIVTAVLNEERILPGFLDKIQDFAKEIIVVVDYRTHDKSADIAEKRGCKVLIDKGESEGIVFNNKNWGIEESKHDWVLILDADERMNETLQKEIADVVEGRVENSQPVMYQTGFINYEFGKYFTECDQPKKKFVRLFKKGSFKYITSKTAEGIDIQKGVFNEKRNSTVNFLIRLPVLRSLYIQRNPQIENFKGLLIHNSHPTITEFLQKINLYSSREAKIFLSKNHNLSTFAIYRRLVIWPVKEFIYKYFIWQLYKEGIHGYIVSVIFAFYRFLMAAKIYTFYYKRINKDIIEKKNEKYNFLGQLDED